MTTHPSFIVTGGAGFIGCNLVKALNARGHKDILVVDSLSHPQKQKNLDAVEFETYMDKAEFREAFRSDSVRPPLTVFHLGACSATTQLDTEYLADNNLGYTRELCEWSLQRNVRYIYASSAATYGDGEKGYSDDPALIPSFHPLNPYGQSKQDFDVHALQSGLLSKIVGLKYFNVYGPHEDHKGDMRSVVNKAYSQILDTGKLQLFKSHRPDYRDGEQDRDFIYVRDAVDVTLYFHDNPTVSGLYNCGTGRARTWLDLAHAIFAAMELPPQIEMIDMPDHLRERYQYHTEADVSNLRAAGYSADFTSIEAGVRDYVQNFLSQN